MSDDTKISQWKADVRRWGFARSLYIRAMRRVTRYLGFFIYHLGSYEMVSNPEIPCRLPNITYRELSRDDLQKASEDPEQHLTMEFVDAALERGDIAFGAYDGSDLVSYVWSSSTSAPHAHGVWVRMKPPHAYGYKALTRADLRGHRLAPSVLLFANAKMLSQGYKYRTGYIATTNFSNKQSGRSLGGVPVGWAGYLKVFGHILVFRTPKAKKIGFEFFKAQ